MNFLVICSGNICRSPMAELYLRHQLVQDGERAPHRVTSGGTLGLVGEAAAPAAIAVLAEESALDLKPHRSRGVSREEVEDADLILVMESGHRRYLSTFYSSHARKVRLLSEYAPAGAGLARGADLFDPVGMEPEAFRNCYRLIRACLDEVLGSLGR